MTDQSPEFPSVGARARFTFNPKWRGESSDLPKRTGSECTITDRGMGTSLWVAFDDGRCAPVLPDELSPLPAAPTETK
jgi:hypothetical protein